jgi:hypothetical protein
MKKLPVCQNGLFHQNKLNQNIIFLIISKFNSLAFIYVTVWMGDRKAFFKEIG